MHRIRVRCRRIGAVRAAVCVTALLLQEVSPASGEGPHDPIEENAEQQAHREHTEDHERVLDPHRGFHAAGCTGMGFEYDPAEEGFGSLLVTRGGEHGEQERPGRDDRGEDSRGEQQAGDVECLLHDVSFP